MNWYGGGLITIINYASGIGPVNPPPPGTSDLITNSGLNIITNSGMFILAQNAP